MQPITVEGTKFFITSDPQGEKLLRIEGRHDGFSGKEVQGGFHCPLNSHNAAVLRERIPWLNPQPLGLATSFGFGDRLGSATPGHISAVRGTGIAPIFAQQSVRENQRTGRSPQIVLDDAIWAVLEEGWAQPWGADADHVKEIRDLPPFFAAGYTFYTIDPNLHVDNQAHVDDLETLKNKAGQVPWSLLETDLERLGRNYIQNPVIIQDSRFEFSQEDFYRAVGKYARALAHIKTLSDHLVKQLGKFDLEVSVDETDTPTSVKEHYFIATELRRLNVPFISLAPRFIGSFEKGVDYIGDVKAFEQELINHAKVMHTIGGYKLSIHTGSDKFSIYPVIARHARNLVHVKTAGTSYLEALRVIAVADIPLFREIFEFSCHRYQTDKATYNVSGMLENVPLLNNLGDADLPALFDHFDTRQVLHVTFGSVLDNFGPRIHQVIKENSATYRGFLTSHFSRHLEPFSAWN